MENPFQWVRQWGSNKRCSKYIDKNPCQKCFDFPSIANIKDRIKRMDKIFHIEQSLVEPKCQEQVM